MPPVLASPGVGLTPQMLGSSLVGISAVCVCVLGAGRGTPCQNAARDLAEGTPPSQASKPFFKDLTQEHVFIDLGEEGRGEGEKH